MRYLVHFLALAVTIAVRPEKTLEFRKDGKFVQRVLHANSRAPEIPSCVAILKRGSKGEQVRLLQEALNFLAFGGERLAVDGDFGKGTHDALLTFQAIESESWTARLGAKKPVVDGVFNCDDAAALEEQINAKKGSSNEMACTWTKHSGMYSGHFAGGVPIKFKTAFKAQRKCLEMAGDCKAVTCSQGGACPCTLRASMENDLQTSASGEETWIPSPGCYIGRRHTEAEDGDAEDACIDAGSNDGEGASLKESSANNLLSAASAETLKDQVPSIADICNLPGSLAGKVKTETDLPIAQQMEAKGYDVYTEPGEVNVVGVRKVDVETSNMTLDERYSNAFRDDLYIFWKCDGSDAWQIYQTQFTTVPGSGTKGLEGRSLTSVMHPGQYKYAYCQGTHGGNAAMRQVNTVQQYLIFKDASFKQSNGRPVVDNKKNSLNFHGTKSSKIWESTNVNNWSHGCQVTSGSKFFNEVLALIYSSTNAHPHSPPDMANCKDQDGGEKRTNCDACMTYTLLNKA